MCDVIQPVQLTSRPMNPVNEPGEDMFFPVIWHCELVDKNWQEPVGGSRGQQCRGQRSKVLATGGGYGTAQGVGVWYKT